MYVMQLPFHSGTELIAHKYLKTTHELDDLDTALANLAQAEHELDELNNKVHQDIQNCEVMIAMQV